MARAADGTYTNPNTLVPNTLANATRVQENFDDVALGLTDSLSRSGKGGMTAALVLTNGTLATHAMSLGQAQNDTATWGGTATGTTSNIIVSLTPVPTAITAGMRVRFLMGASDSAAGATLDIGITTGAPPVAVTYPIRRQDGTTVIAGDLTANSLVSLECDGTGFRVAGIVPGDVSSSLAPTTRTTDATLTSATNSTIQDCAAALTLALDQASVLATGWFNYVRNNTTAGTVTVQGYRAADQAVNGSFTGSTGWTLGAGWSIGTTAVGTATSTSVSQAQTLTAGQLYEVVFTLSAFSAGTVRPRFTGGTTVTGTARSANGTYTETLRAVAGNATLEFLGAAFTGAIDNVEIRRVEEIDGATTASVAPGETRLIWCDGTTSHIVAPYATRVDIYTSSATWTKVGVPALILVECVGGGGGAGGGSITTSTTSPCCGGGGGGGAAFGALSFRADQIAATVAVTVGSGGNGGAGGSGASSVDGTSGSTGGTSSFGSYLSAPGGGGGGSAGNGTTSTAGGAGGSFAGGGLSGVTNGGGSGSGDGTLYGGANGSGAGVGAAVPGRNVSFGGSGAGGGTGGTLTNTNTVIAAGAGGTTLAASTAAAVSAGAGAAGSAVTTAGFRGGGGGGAGGAAATTGSTFAGGAGGTPGGGGGGGGAARGGAGISAGTGGNGGRGEVRVWTIY